MQVHLLAVLAIARLVAATHAQHVHAVHLQPVDHCAGAAHLVLPLPAPARGRQPSTEAAPGAAPRHHPPAAVLHRVVPGGGGLLGQPPAQEELVVGQGALGVDDRGQRSCVRGRRRGGAQVGMTAVCLLSFVDKALLQVALVQI